MCSSLRRDHCLLPLDYRLNGRRETVTFGKYGPTGLSLARARELCIDAKRAIKEGRSPVMVDSPIASGRDRVWKASVIRSGIRSRAELNCALPLFLHPSHQRDTADRPIGTGRLCARRGFGYWGEQIGHLRDRSGHHFGARRQNSSLQLRVGVETAMENVESTGRPATDR
jgi:hypothetical protein